MEISELEHLFCATPMSRVVEARNQVPCAPGYYAIFVDVPDSLPEPFSTHLQEKSTNLIYVGVATRSLAKRLIEQDLTHKSPSTVFRGLGALLGYRPICGSLHGKKNKNNYKFSDKDTASIITWIDEHLSVAWAESKPAEDAVEQALIGQLKPILNSKHNSERIPELAELRKECREIARSET